jgi:photosystem II stability/assembly factor-like uncharacterized protein
MKKLLLISIMVISAIFANAQWQQTNGPYGGFVTCLATCGTNIFAGTYGGGVFLSTDNGSNWTPVNSGLLNHVVSSLAFSGSNIFAGTNGGGVFFSTDNGNNWTAVNSDLINYDVRCLVVSGLIFLPQRGGEVYFCPQTAVATGVR